MQSLCGENYKIPPETFICTEDTTTDIAGAQTLFRGTIKWDACSHVTFGDESGYIHLCGGGAWKSMIVAMERIFRIATNYFKEDHQKEFFDDFDELLTRKQ